MLKITSKVITYCYDTECNEPGSESGFYEVCEEVEKMSKMGWLRQSLERHMPYHIDEIKGIVRHEVTVSYSPIEQPTTDKGQNEMNSNN